MSPSRPETMYCTDETSKSIRSTNHIEAIKPTVPQILMGGKSSTGSSPHFSRMLYATELDRAMVGI